LRLGRLRKDVKKPGICFIVPLFDRLKKVDLRTVTLPVDSQNVITKDNVQLTSPPSPITRFPMLLSRL